MASWRGGRPPGAPSPTSFFWCRRGGGGGRRAARHLPSFYMWMSAGGMIGGIAAGLAAPYLFNWIAEYPILIALAVLCRPGLALPQQRLEQVIFFGAIAIAAFAIFAFHEYSIPLNDHVFTWV